jgi:hypothetical protein
MNKLNNQKMFLAIGLIVLAAVSRLFPILPNFQPVMAIALFAGVAFSGNRILSLAVPIGALLISDILLHFFSQNLFGFYVGFHESMFAVYLSFGLIVLLSSKFNKNATTLSVLGTSLFSAILFFVVTNLSSWMFSLDINNVPYAKDWSGLVWCFTSALPFFKYTVASVLLYSGLMFGLFYSVEKLILEPIKVK